MKKIILSGLVAALMAVSTSGAASPAVTANVPLDSSYYVYVEKLEAMGYIKDMPAGTKPYSRLDMAKWVAAIDPAGMPDYLRAGYEEMSAGLAEEIAFIRGESSRLSNVKLREAGVQFSYFDMDQNSYKNGAGINSSYQPLNKNNNGHRYGDGFNAVGKLNISGSLNKNLAMGIAPRFSYDDDQNGEAKLDEGYVKMHLGVWGIEVGRQPMQWGGVGHNSAFALSNNARPQTMIKLNLLEPHTFDNGFLRFLGKANVNIFYSKMDDDRRDRAQASNYPKWDTESNDMEMIGIRVDITPTHYFTFGIERVSMLESVNKDWILGDNAENNDQWNDIGGFDFRLKFPGVQFYGSAYGEDQAGGLPCEWAYSGGVYFPQLVSDGSWDLRLEAAKTNKWWYKHWTFKNGWNYRDDILGDAMGNNAVKLSAEINHYLNNGDRLGLLYTNTDMDRAVTNNPKLQEVQITYAKKLQKNMYLDAVAGYAKLKNANFSNSSDSSKMIGLGLRWEY